MYPLLSGFLKPVKTVQDRGYRGMYSHMKGFFFHKKKKEYSLYTILLLKVVDFHLISHIASTNKIDQSTGEGDENEEAEGQPIQSISCDETVHHLPRIVHIIFFFS